MQPFNTIIFDLGGVLINLDFSKTANAFKAMGITEFEHYFKLGHAASYFKSYENGEINDAEFIYQLQQSTHHRFSEQQIRDAWNAMLLDFPEERINWVKELKQQYRLFLFSNTNAIHASVFEQRFHDNFGEPFASLFEKIYYSHEMGFRKPDLAGYEYIIRENKLDPAATLFIDDAQVNIEGARKAGLQTLYIEPGMSVEKLDYFTSSKSI